MDDKEFSNASVTRLFPVWLMLADKTRRKRLLHGADKAKVGRKRLRFS
jgi:hypothetical protein